VPTRRGPPGDSEGRQRVKPGHGGAERRDLPAGGRGCRGRRAPEPGRRGLRGRRSRGGVREGNGENFEGLFGGDRQMSRMERDV
jgi:hypothetical protein